jgi:galactokinase
MTPITTIVAALKSGKANPLLEMLYGNKPGAVEKQTNRYLKAIESFQALYPAQTDIQLFSSPGRTEVGGNHTDHNAGHILAAAVDLDVLAVVAPNNDGVIRMLSQGYSQDRVDLSQLEPVEAEWFTSAALTRGVCARFHQLGYKIGGFDGYAISTVPNGAGLSSSAAYEVLISAIENDLYNGGKLDAVLRAQISQYSENNFFNKPCGLMDQSTCSVGGFVTIDFKDFEHPIVRKVEYNFAASGFSMVIVGTGGNHADLNEDYTALEHEMKSVARAFGGQVLREFSEQKVLENMAFLRTKVNDRAILRALHFYGDDQRVLDQVAALESNNFKEFLRLIIESGYSSWMWCQNCYSHKNIEEQGISIALAVSEKLLAGKGAWRVHGGGFGGTIQAFVPNEMLADYVREMNAVFGEGACHELMIRPAGAICLDIAG